MRIFIYYIGKRRDANTNALAEEYVRRICRYAPCEMREIHPGRFDPWRSHPSAAIVLLDPLGKPVDSGQFSRKIQKAEEEARELVFLVGGHDGLPEAWKSRSGEMLSISPLTFPHELARAVLAEQIYRAFTILRGHPYPR